MNKESRSAKRAARTIKNALKIKHELEADAAEKYIVEKIWTTYPDKDSFVYTVVEHYGTILIDKESVRRKIEFTDEAAAIKRCNELRKEFIRCRISEMKYGNSKRIY